MRIEEESSLAKYFTMVPNIVFDIGLKPVELAVFMAIRRIAGDKSKCFKSMKNLAEAAGVDVKTCRRVKRLLAMPQPVIGMPLIRISEKFSEEGDQEADVITCVDLWDFNLKFFLGVLPKTVGGTTKNGRGGTTKNGRGVLPKTVAKEEPFEEEPINNTEPINNFFYPCLLGIQDIAGNGITEKDAIWLTEKYDEATVQHAVEYHRRKKGPYKDKPLIAILKWVCRDKVELPYSIDEMIDDHIHTAKQIEHQLKFPTTVVYDILNKGIEIRHSTGHTIPTFVQYDNPSFKDLLKMSLEKYLGKIPPYIVKFLIRHRNLLPSEEMETTQPEPEMDYANF